MSVDTECCGWDAWGELAGMGSTRPRSVAAAQWSDEPGRETQAQAANEPVEQDSRTVRETHEDR